MNLVDRLRRNWERARTEPGLKRNVIVLASLLVLALGAGSWILSSQRFTGPWEDRFTLAAEFDAVPGVAPGQGQEVRMFGVIVGQITDARVNSRGRAELELSLDPTFEGKVHENATLVLRPKSPLNEMYVEMDPGGLPARPMVDGGTFSVSNTERPIQVDEVLGHLDDKARAGLTSLLAEADIALVDAERHLPSGLDATSTTVNDLGPVMVELEKRRTSLARLVTAVSEMSAAIGEDDERLTRLSSALSSTLGSMAGKSDELDASLAELPKLTDRLRTSTEAVSKLTKQLDPTLRGIEDATDELPDALDRIDDTVSTLRTTVRIARPVVRNARPLVADLRPAAAELRRGLPIAERSVARLDPVTATLLKYMPDLGAFVVQSGSMTELKDANGGILRGSAMVTSESIPDMTGQDR